MFTTIIIKSKSDYYGNDIFSILPSFIPLCEGSLFFDSRQKFYWKFFGDLLSKIMVEKSRKMYISIRLSIYLSILFENMHVRKQIFLTRSIAKYCHGENSSPRLWFSQFNQQENRILFILFWFIFETIYARKQCAIYLHK